LENEKVSTKNLKTTLKTLVQGARAETRQNNGK